MDGPRTISAGSAGPGGTAGGAPVEIFSQPLSLPQAAEV